MLLSYLEIIASSPVTGRRAVRHSIWLIHNCAAHRVLCGFRSTIKKNNTIFFKWSTSKVTNNDHDINFWNVTFLWLLVQVQSRDQHSFVYFSSKLSISFHFHWWNCFNSVIIYQITIYKYFISAQILLHFQSKWIYFSQIFNQLLRPVRKFNRIWPESLKGLRWFIFLSSE